MEVFQRSPAQLTLDLAGVDCVAEVVAGAVGDKRNELRVASCELRVVFVLVARCSRLVALAPRGELVHEVADEVDEVDVSLLIVAADVVGLAGSAFFDDR